MTNSSPTTEVRYVLDTVAIVSHLDNRKGLGSRAREVFAAAERGEARLLVPPIVVAELFWYFSKRAQRDRFRQVFSDMRTRPWFQFIDLTAEQVSELWQPTQYQHNKDLQYQVKASKSILHRLHFAAQFCNVRPRCKVLICTLQARYTFLGAHHHHLTLMRLPGRKTRHSSTRIHIIARIKGPSNGTGDQFAPG